MGNCSTQVTQNLLSVQENSLVLGRKYQNILVQLTKGKYLKEYVDLLVIPLKNKDIHLKNQDLNEIMSQLGSKAKNELRENEFDEHNILITSGGSLNCSRILFVLLKPEKNIYTNETSKQDNPLIQVTLGGTPIQQSIYTAMKNSLHRAKKINALSIAFPEIKEQNLKTQEIATVMLSTIKEFLEEETDKGLLQTITISLEDDYAVNTFKWTINRFFQRRFSDGQKNLGNRLTQNESEIESSFGQSTFIKEFDKDL